MFLGQIIIVYAYYNVWEARYRKTLHVVFGFIAAFFGLMAMTMIDAVASYMLTPLRRRLQTLAARSEPDDGAPEHAPFLGTSPTRAFSSQGGLEVFEEHAGRR